MRVTCIVQEHTVAQSPQLVPEHKDPNLDPTLLVIRIIDLSNRQEVYSTVGNYFVTWLEQCKTLGIGHF